MKKFNNGDRVKISGNAIKNGLVFGNSKYEASTTGWVVSNFPPFVRIKRDYRKTIERYHQDFWELFD